MGPGRRFGLPVPAKSVILAVLTLTLMTGDLCCRGVQTHRNDHSLSPATEKIVEHLIGANDNLLRKMEEKTPTACKDREKLPFLVGVRVPCVMEWSLDYVAGGQLADADPLADVDLLWNLEEI